jgi:mono/diheme cytochrome c family protein
MIRFILVATVLITAAVPVAGALAAADGPGNAGYGRVVAIDLCGDCHIVSPDQSPDGMRPGPNLMERVRQPEITELALRSYLRTSHPVMPNIMLTQEQADDIIAYLMTFKGSAK